MKYAILAIISVLIFLLSGCVNVGDQVALIGHYEKNSGKPCTNFLLSAVNASDAKTTDINRSLLNAVALWKKEQDKSGIFKHDNMVNLNVQFEYLKNDNSLSAYEAISGIFTFFTLGIWPTIMSDKNYYMLRINNDNLNIKCPLVIEKRYSNGWISALLPVPAWADWRGNEKDMAEGEGVVIKNALKDILSQGDYHKSIIHQLVNNKYQLVKKQDRILRPYALKFAAGKWSEIQQLRAEMAITQRDMAKFYSELKMMGDNPHLNTEFMKIYQRFCKLKKSHDNLLMELANSYSSHFTQERKAFPSSDEVSLEDILESIEQPD